MGVPIGRRLAAKPAVAPSPAGRLTRNTTCYTQKKSFEIVALIAVRQFSNLACNLDNGPAVFVIGSAGMRVRGTHRQTVTGD
jgi:hypothetical protein